MTRIGKSGWATRDDKPAEALYKTPRSGIHVPTAIPITIVERHPKEIEMRTRAAIIREPGKPWEVTTLELDDPGPGEVLIKFTASGMCHSDEHMRSGDTEGRLPMVGGHEGAGVVEAVGDAVMRVRVGDHVVCSFIPACGACRYCSTGRQNLCDQAPRWSPASSPMARFAFTTTPERTLGASAHWARSRSGPSSRSSPASRSWTTSRSMTWGQ